MIHKICWKCCMPFLVGLCMILIVGCSHPYAEVTNEWIEENVDKDHCIEENCKKLCAVNNPCIIGTQGDYQITEEMIEECCEIINNESMNCNFESPEYEVKWR